MKNPKRADLDEMEYPPHHPVWIVRDIYEQAVAKLLERGVSIEGISFFHQCTGPACSWCDCNGDPYDDDP